MDNKKCFQCEQTAGYKTCTGTQGVSEEKADVALSQYEVASAISGLVRATEGNEHLVNENTDKLILDGLFQ